MIGGGEIFIIALVFLLLFGSKNIPEMARGLGKGVRELKKATDNIKREIENTDIVRDIKDIKGNVENMKPTINLNNDLENTDILKDIKDIKNNIDTLKPSL